MPRQWIRWTEVEIELLEQLYKHTPKADLIAKLAPHTWKSIVTVASERGLHRPKPPAMDAAERLRRKRLAMAQRRADPTLRLQVLETQRKSYERRGRDRQRDRAVRRRTAHFFWYRADRYSGITARDLARLWRKQRGVCALTGRKLTRSAELDHITPIARGGKDELSNFQWVTPEANRAKRDLSVEEFVALCSDVVEWIGRRIMAVEPALLASMEAR